MKNEDKLGATELTFSLKYDTLEITDFTVELRAKVEYMSLNT